MSTRGGEHTGSRFGSRAGKTVVTTRSIPAPDCCGPRRCHLIPEARRSFANRGDHVVLIRPDHGLQAGLHAELGKQTRQM